MSPGLVLVDFVATWCSVCPATALLVEELVETYAGKLRTARIDVDEHPALAARYQVHAVPTLALVRDGQIIEQFAGFAARDRLHDAIEWALAQ